MLDAAGQVFEWTATSVGRGRFIVKGGSWDDKGCGICRPAARHSRPAGLKHILIGFRLGHIPIKRFLRVGCCDSRRSTVGVLTWRVLI